MISWMANPKPAMFYALSECGGSKATASRSRGERADAPCMRPSMFASMLLYMLFLRRPNLCGFCATACLVYFSYSLHMFVPFSLRLNWGKESLGKFAHDRGAADGRNMHAFIGWCPPDPSYLQGFLNWILLDSDQSTFCALDCLAGLKAQEEYRCAKLWQKRETEGKNCF